LRHRETGFAQDCVVAPAGLEPVTNRLLLPFDMLDRLKCRHID
jgi:hypothetical protein